MSLNLTKHIYATDLPGALYRIHVRNPKAVSKGVEKVIVNDQEVSEGYISLVDDGGEYTVEVIMGEKKNRPKVGF